MNPPRPTPNKSVLKRTKSLRPLTYGRRRTRARPAWDAMIDSNQDICRQELRDVRKAEHERQERPKRPVDLFAGADLASKPVSTQTQTQTTTGQTTTGRTTTGEIQDAAHAAEKVASQTPWCLFGADNNRVL